MKDGDCTSEMGIHRTFSFSSYEIFDTRFCFGGLGKREIDKITGFGFAYGCTQPNLLLNI